MSKNQLISVIIPVYNLENYIERTLKSVCAQTYKDLEIIVVDDGSKDNSFEIIKNFAKKDNRIIPIHQDNAGVTKARVTGITAAKGDWIGFVDGDDEIDEDMYEILLSNAEKYNADISHCGYKMVFEDGRINYFYNTGKIIEQDNFQGQKDLLEGTMVEPGLWNKLYKKSLLDEFLKSNVMDYSIKNLEDLLMNYYLFKAAKKAVFEDVCKYTYYVRNDSSSRILYYEGIYDPIMVRKIILADVDSELSSVAEMSYLATCISKYSSLIVCDNVNKEDLISVRKTAMECKEYKHLLGRNQKILYFMICYCPRMFKIFYRIYSKYFQQKKYE